MTPDEQAIFAWRHKEEFAAIAHYNLEVTIRRLQKQDWSLPENQYIDPWKEIINRGFK